MSVKRPKNKNEMINDRITEWKFGATRRGTNTGGAESDSDFRGLVVTISREAGCDGHAVAKTLSETLGLELYDRKIIELIAKDKEVTAQLVAKLDENAQSDMMSWLNDSLTGSRLSSAAYFNSLRRVLLAIAAHGNAVIVGRGGNLLIPHHKRIAIRLVAPLEMRVKNVMEQSGVTENRARSIIEKTGEERRRFARKYMDEDIDDPTLNDVIINMASVKSETIVDIVKAIHENKSKNMNKGDETT